MRLDNGVWHFEENWFLKYIWGTNLFRAFDRGLGGNSLPVYPKNLCSLFWGSLGGILFCALMSVFVFVATAITVVSAFLGFYPAIFDKPYPDPWYRYKHWKEKKIPVAPWEICLVAGLIYLVYAFGDGILSAGFEGMAGFPALLAQLVQNFIFLQMAFGIIAGLGVSLGIIYFLFRTTPGKVFREYLEAVKKKICPLVVVDKKPTEGK